MSPLKDGATCALDMLELAEATWKNDFDVVMVLPPDYYGQTQHQLMYYFEAPDAELGGKWLA